jgi:thiol-disulfide isomerase/thioredoxin
MSSSYGNYNSAYPKPQPRVETEPSEKYQWTFPIQNREHLGKAIQSFPIVVVKAWAVWCQPCKIAGQKLDAFAETLSDYNKYILFMSDNIDNEDSYFKEQVNVVPTFFVFFQGKIDDHQILEIEDSPGINADILYHHPKLNFIDITEFD